MIPMVLILKTPPDGIDYRKDEVESGPGMGLLQNAEEGRNGCLKLSPILKIVNRIWTSAKALTSVLVRLVLVTQKRRAV